MKVMTKTIAKVAGISLLAGVILIILAFSFSTDASGSNKVYTHSFEEEYTQDIHTISVEFNFGNVEIKQGDAFKIQATNIKKDALISRVTNGVWEIEEEDYNRGSSFRLLDSDVPLANLKYKNKEELNKIVITVPKDYVLDEFDLEIGAGNAEVANLSANRMELDVGAGNLEGVYLEAAREASIEVGAGNIDMKQFYGKNVSLSCGVGNLDIQGDITGDSSAETALGHMKIALTRPQIEYNYNVDSILGSVKINQLEYSKSSGVKVFGDGGDNYFELECGLGDIEITNK